jgi:drug/metabolite transporter superfamily protein YnfA
MTSPHNEGRLWLLWLSIAAQQVVFLLAYGIRFPLIDISEWVIFVPVVIIWALYAVVPLLMPKNETKHPLLRTYALAGWIFVFAAVSWTASYIVLSGRYGTPVSRDRVQQSKANQQPSEPMGRSRP